MFDFLQPHVSLHWRTTLTGWLAAAGISFCDYWQTNGAMTPKGIVIALALGVLGTFSSDAANTERK